MRRLLMMGTAAFVHQRSRACSKRGRLGTVGISPHRRQTCRYQGDAGRNGGVSVATPSLGPALGSPAPCGYRRALARQAAGFAGVSAARPLPQSGGRATLAGYLAKRRILRQQPSNTACRRSTKGRLGQGNDPIDRIRRDGGGAPGGSASAPFSVVHGPGYRAASRELTARTGFRANTANGGAKP